MDLESIKSNLTVLEAEKRIEENNFPEAIESLESALKNVSGLPEIAYLYHRRAFCKLNMVG